jgi:hypothetical protein
MNKDDMLVRAKKCRQLAEAMRDPKARESFAMAAQSWEAMAYGREKGPVTLMPTQDSASHRRQRSS